eukprot:c33552_g1_i1 orf=1-366(-)
MPALAALEHACGTVVAVASSTTCAGYTRALWSPLSNDSSSIARYSCHAKTCKIGFNRKQELHGSCHASCTGGASYLKVLAEASHVSHALKSGSISQGEDYTRYFDFVVIGSGIAGLRYALDV